jgi:hypothetical protein
MFYLKSVYLLRAAKSARFAHRNFSSAKTVKKLFSGYTKKKKRYSAFYLEGFIMRKSTLNSVIGSALAAGAGIFAFRAIQERNKLNVPKDIDMRNSSEVDKRESVIADTDPAEKGLSQLDSAYREEWQANAFPQTHREMKELEEEK